jgi:hypothetical protein
MPLETETLITDDMSQGSWTYGGGFLYWTNNCAGSVDPVTGYLKRRAEDGLITGVLTQTLQCEVVSNDLIADEDGVFYWNYANNELQARYTDDPGIAVKIADISPIYPMRMAIDDLWVYYTQPDGIYRTTKEAEITFQTSDATGITSLTVDDDFVYWMDTSGLWRSDRTCITPGCWNQKEHLTSTPGSYLSWHGQDTLVWSYSDASNWYIAYHQLGVPGSFTYYWSPKTTTDLIGRVIVHNDTLYWLERFVTSDVALRRRELPDGLIENLADGLWEYTPYRLLTAGQGGTIFADDAGIYRVPYGADPVTRDLSLDYFEVTQAIQNLEDHVQLARGKPTYVRLYGSVAAGSHAPGVEVVLRGYRGGNELPDSPLYPLNGPQKLTLGQLPGRAIHVGNWLFRLPDSWTGSGDLHLEAEVDPRDLYDDANPSNDILADDFTFLNIPPTCLYLVPVWTHAGIELTWQNPRFDDMIDIYERMWPSTDTHIFYYHDYLAMLTFCEQDGWLLPCYGPYWLPRDSWRVLNSLRNLDTFNTDPSECRSHDGRTHWVGMVHPDTNTGTTLGTGMLFGFDQLWVKFAPHFDPRPATNLWNWPKAGVILAHEMGHNYDRYHVDCGGPDDPDDDYPYASCTLDDRGLTEPWTHYGYDVGTMTPIPPTSAADLMSYGDLLWVSDYTYNAIFALMRLPFSLAGDGSAERIPLSQAESAILTSGVFTPSLNLGQLEYAWVFPTATLGSGLLQKWENLVASPFTPEAAPTTPQYHVRLLDAGGMALDDRVFTPTSHLDTPHPRTAFFQVTLPAPADEVAQIDLMIDDTVVDSISPGAHTPTVEILLPAGGEVFDDEISIVWRAQDADGADRLRHTVQYSPDLGQTWQALAANLPSDPHTSWMTLTVSNLPGSSTGGLVQVASSDGYHTGISVSNAFQVSNQPPEPYIVSPDAEQQFEAGWPVQVRGGARDAEDGSLSGASLTWELDGSAVGNDRDLLLQGLAPGDYNVTLNAEDAAGQTATAQSTLKISPLHVVSTTSPLQLDGLCEETAYTETSPILLAPYSDGAQAAVRLARTDTDLWACFSGLSQGTGGEIAFAGLRVDVDHSDDPWAQSDDYGFLVKEDGTPFTKSGDGSGGFDNAGPGGLQARIYAQSSTWSAELRIDAAVLGGWGHLVGLDLGHYDVAPVGDDYHWPYAASWNQPDTWATTVFGEFPRILELSPSEALAGSGDLALFVNGDHFVEGATILWNGQAQPTGFWTEHYLSTIISASDLVSADMVTVTVVNPGLEESPSNAQWFLIKSPVPTITALVPISATEGGPDFTLTINGTNFVDGAMLFWNGQARPTSFANSSQIQATIYGSDLELARIVGVSVLNPEPTDGTSATAYFEVEARPLPFHIYLPIISR